MVNKVFVWGRTGSGKSTTVRMLSEEAQQLGWSVVSFNDYFYLRQMFEADDGKSFRSTEHNGFEVLDQHVYTEALRCLEQAVQSFQPSSAKTLITIEFTSNNYLRALEVFSSDFLQDAHYFFMLADLRRCLNRVKDRTSHSLCEDDYFVVDTVLLQHYPCPYLPISMNKEIVTRIPNMEDLYSLRMHIKQLVPDLLKITEAMLTNEIKKTTVGLPG